MRNTKKLVLFPVNTAAMIAVLAFMSNLLFTSLREVDQNSITTTQQTNDQQVENIATLPQSQE